MAASTIALRLFARADASRQIDMRVLGEGDAITLGRDESADWVLPDPERALSRRHLSVALRDGAVSVTDTSTNGVLSAGRTGRLPRDAAVRVDAGERLELGPYALLIERSEREPTPAPPPAARGPANPFLPQGASGEGASAQAARRPDPFAGGLAPDPLAPPTGGRGEHPFSAGAEDRAGPLLDDDAWRRRPERGADSWRPEPPREAPRLGEPGAWVDAPKTEAEDRGFGFEAPFRQPILRAPEVKADDLAIPSDWDRVPAAPEAFAAPDAPALATQDPSPAEQPLLSEVLGAPPPSAPSPTPLPAPTPSPPAPQPPSEPPREGLDAGGPSAPRAVDPPGLLAAFCAGARLDPAAFAAEDPAALMQRLGAIYRHMVAGLSDVLGERTALKNEYRMVRTTIQAEDNNPFKWAPAQKVAVELLRAHNDGFLDGPAAVSQSYQDVKTHLLCMLAGLRAALGSSLDALAPERMEEAVKDQVSMLKPKAALAWAEYVRVHGQYRQEAQDSADSQVNREFRAAYEKQLEELDRLALR